MAKDWFAADPISLTAKVTTGGRLAGSGSERGAVARFADGSEAEADIVVGAPAANDGAGAAYILFGTAVFEMATFLVAALVQRLQHLFEELRPAFEYGGRHVRRQIGESRQIRLLLDLEQLMEHEQKIVDGGLVAGHAVLGGLN